MEEYYRISLAKELWWRRDYNQINQYLVIAYTELSTVNVNINIEPNLIEEIMS